MCLRVSLVGRKYVSIKYQIFCIFSINYFVWFQSIFDLWPRGRILRLCISLDRRRLQWLRALQHLPLSICKHLKFNILQPLLDKNVILNFRSIPNLHPQSTTSMRQRKGCTPFLSNTIYQFIYNNIFTILQPIFDLWPRRCLLWMRISLDRNRLQWIRALQH